MPRYKKSHTTKFPRLFPFLANIETNAGKKKRKQEHFPDIVYVFGDFGNNIGQKETNTGENKQTLTKKGF
ncbi:hypothetical protein AXE75_03870 [Gardnerella vaginalis]|uniref:hypothetical protein n=1 Tax=Gardnerella vaginalis TaxID=2702 RepID=UPI000E315161|nr:hypothetical protein [Gardnerella vaginalis]RFD76444.1 hypothetical protein AXE75_03870 [Gardnerella vaginalis]